MLSQPAPEGSSPNKSSSSFSQTSLSGAKSAFGELGVQASQVLAQVKLRVRVLELAHTGGHGLYGRVAPLAQVGQIQAKVEHMVQAPHQVVPGLVVVFNPQAL